MTDEIGNIYVTGTFYSLNDFDPGPETFYLASLGSADIFLLKLDLEGNFIWAKAMGGEGFDIGNSVASDKNYNLYLTGWFEGIADFDPGPDTFSLWTGGFEDDRGIFITKLDGEGNFVWAKKIGNQNSDITGRSIVADDLGNSYTIGKFRGGADFNPGADTNILTSENDRAFVIKLDSAGNYCWLTAMEGDGKSTGSDITIDKHNDVYTIGYFKESIDFDPGSDTFNLNAAYWDTYILKLTSAGEFVWAGSFYGGASIGTTAAGNPSVDVDQWGNIHTTGFFTNSNDFDPGEEVHELLFFGGLGDAFIHKMRQYCFSRPGINVDNNTVCQGDTVSLKAIMDIWVSAYSYSWSTGDTTDMVLLAPESNTTYTVEINYTEDSLNCNMMSSIGIEVLPIPDTTQLESTSCDSLSAGQQVSIYPAENGCDSIVKINTLWLPIPAIPQAPLEVIITPTMSIFEINVPPVLTATIYEWTIPLGVELLSGEGTNAIVLDWSALNTGGTVCVSAVNECGNSALACTEITLDIIDALLETQKNEELNAIIFPNPVDQTLQVLFENADHRKLRLISAQGKVVFQKDCFNEKLFINTADFPAGVYSLRIQHAADKYVNWEKIVML